MIGVGTIVLIKPKIPDCKILTKELNKGNYSFGKFKDINEQQLYMIFNMSYNSLLLYAKWFNLESFMFAEVKKDILDLNFYHIEDKDYKKDITIEGFVKIDKKNKFYIDIEQCDIYSLNKMKRPLNKFVEEIKKNCKEINGYKEQLEETVFNACSDKFTGKSQWLARCRLTGKYCADFYKKD